MNMTLEEFDERSKPIIALVQQAVDEYRKLCDEAVGEIHLSRYEIVGSIGNLWLRSIPYTGPSL